jgi:DNA polymerase III delta subunit
MSPAADINNTAPPRVVVMTGDDSIARERTREKLIEQMRALHKSLTEERFDSSRESFQLFAERMLTSSLFSSMRLFQIRHANDLSARELDLLADIVATPLPDTAMIIEIDAPARGAGKVESIVQKLDVKKKAKKANGEYALLQFVKPPDYKLAQWLTQQVPLLFSRQISKPTADYLVDLIGNELDMLYSELLKLDIHLPPGAPIDKTSVECIVGATRTMNVYELARALGAKNFNRSSEIIDSLCTANVSFPTAVSAIFRHFWALYRIRIFAEANRDQLRIYRDKSTAYDKKNEVAHAIGLAAGLLKTGEPINKAYPVVVLSGVVDQARTFTLAELKQIIRLLQEFDSDIKAGRREPSKGNFLQLCYQIVRITEIDKEPSI